jgi:site-specific DNA-methyltransferase (adenine-specific)
LHLRRNGTGPGGGGDTEEEVTMLAINEIHHGDALELLRRIPSGTVDAVVMDPPYCSGARTSAEVTNRGGMSRGARWNAKPLDSDQMTSTGFVWLMRQVGREALRILKRGGWFVSFIDWRQYPALFGAIETTNLRVCGMLCWDKEAFALGNGFRNQHELALIATKGVGRPHNRATGNVLRVNRINASDLHPTEKPVELLRQILRVVSPPGGLVVDPFVGSGTTAIAARLEGMDFVGIERELEYVEVARQRVAESQGAAVEVAGGRVQLGFFGEDEAGVMA